MTLAAERRAFVFAPAMGGFLLTMSDLES